MNTWLTRCFAGLLLVLPFVPAVADDPDDKTDKTSEPPKAICEKFNKVVLTKDVDAAMKLVAAPWFDKFGGKARKRMTFRVNFLITRFPHHDRGVLRRSANAYPAAQKPMMHQVVFSVATLVAS